VIQQLKLDYNANKNQIFDLELRLSTIIDIELKDELALVKKLERLNDEKITAHFLKMAKLPESGSDLRDIRDEDDWVFTTDTERTNHITNFYRDPFKIPPPVPDQIQRTTIEEFLGDVAQHPEVIASKISDEEKLSLDRPLSIAELDFSVSKAKLNSAPGIDGISNRFIKDFWEFFRVPLHK
jgi:hypothetical protein